MEQKLDDLYALFASSGKANNEAVSIPQPEVTPAVPETQASDLTEALPRHTTPGIRTENPKFCQYNPISAFPHVLVYSNFGLNCEAIPTNTPPSTTI